jgi:hypothetical protein
MEGGWAAEVTVTKCDVAVAEDARYVIHRYEPGATLTVNVMLHLIKQKWLNNL